MVRLLKRSSSKSNDPRCLHLARQFPLTSSGKLDRKALPVPHQSHRLSFAAKLAPRDDTEADIARLWLQHLDHDELSVFDHFIELGGDSLIAMRIAAAAQEQGLAISSQLIFQHPTVAALAAVVAEQARTPQFQAQADASDTLSESAKQAGISDTELQALLAEFDAPIAREDP